MARGIEKLSKSRVNTLTRAGLYGDGANLWLKVTETGSKSWVFRYTLDGKARPMGLGPIHTVSLDEARDEARKWRKVKLDGRDPITVRNEERAQGRKAVAAETTFQQIAERWIAKERPGWTPKHLAQVQSAFHRFIHPRIGALPVKGIATEDVMAVLEPIWLTKNYAGTSCRGYLEKVLDYAKVLQLRDGENPARWRGHLVEVLAKPAKMRNQKLRGTDLDGHHAALPYAELPSFMAELRGTDGDIARVIEFAILTAARIGEVIQASWSQIDLEAGTWTLPPGRMKAGKEHVVLLSEPAIALLRALPRQPDDRVFALRWPTYANRLLAKLRPGITLHGFRSSFSNWAHEVTSYDHHSIEIALAHTVGTEVERAYRRGDMREKRKSLMAAWAAYCAPAAGGNVVTIGGR